MHFDMLLERSLASVSLVALITPEWFFPRMLPHVLLQITRRLASIDALITLERLFCCMLSHNVTFQFNSCNARILAQCASLWLFSRVGPCVPLQIA